MNKLDELNSKEKRPAEPVDYQREIELVKQAIQSLKQVGGIMRNSQDKRNADEN
jgi:hypothetical protein